MPKLYNTFFILTYFSAKMNCEPPFEKIPLGDENISTILKNDKIYIDKTSHALKLIKKGGHYFQSRPMKFGKTLFLDTLKEILKGNEVLFKNCDIAKMNYTWDKNAVLYFDFSTLDHYRIGLFEQEIKTQLMKMAERNGIYARGKTLESYLKSLLSSLSKKFDKNHPRVAILIDNYDSSIVNILETPMMAKENMNTVVKFLKNIESLHEFVWFSFVTGATSFLSEFHEDKLNYITMDPKYSTIVGFTETEIKSHYREFIQHMAKMRSTPEKEVTEEEILNELRSWYGGYNFFKRARSSDLVYNPWSVMSYFKEMRAQNYMLEMSKSSFVAREILKHPEITYQLIILRDHKIFSYKKPFLDIFDMANISLMPLLFQTGYLTISSYEADEEKYDYRPPNKEMEECLYNISNFEEVTTVRLYMAHDILINKRKT